ncbi:polyphosphate kinase [Roseivivax lentus]|uniref:Polyphosphate kinase n=1 Tax=Roseivivax lentus TaxID=633194 RepID=A0A1N7L0E4_9RHOB|nr:DUF1007 family protein [Roseivivax lentus]SIS67291.1 polyphosphate kinase [Roseivivax lentus]
MTSRFLPSLICVALLAPGAASAHPHIFIDTAFELLRDAEGRAVAIRIDWAYDEFYSLLLIEENGLDRDSDGLPEPGPLAEYAGRDVDWEAGFPGDFVLAADGVAVALERPVDHAARFEAGRIVTSHTRPLAEPLDVAAHRVTAQSYDPTYFVAYDVPQVPTVSGQPACVFTREAADRAAAQAEYGDQLAQIDAGDDPFEEIELPDIGVMFADTFVLSCAASS